ncbi:MAG: WYL domain-containing protein, partial [Clostridiales bacterium]|nr:WYL domain-containing protein [Clostridiales bacterium]
RYGNKTIRLAEPYQLVLKSIHWYFQGYCYQRKEFRLFKLSRISKLQLQEEVFTPRDYEKPQLDITDILDSLQKNVKIRVHKSILDRVLEYCTFEDVFPDGENHYIANFPFIENDYYYNILFGFGNQCECLEPVYVRREMKHRIQNMAAIYESEK